MTKAELRSQLLHARPTLKQVAPLSYWLCVGFGLVNLLICFILLRVSTPVKNAPLAVTQGFVGFHLWGYIYGLLGVYIFWTLYRNNWKLTRRALIFGLFTKIMWTIALLVLVFQGFNVYVTLTLWLFLAWTQAFLIVHFLPVINWDGKGKDER